MTPTRSSISANISARPLHPWLLLLVSARPLTNPGDANGLGLQIWDVYQPSGNRSIYPARSTMAETVALINSELTEAFNNLKAYEDAGNLENCGFNASRQAHTLPLLSRHAWLLSPATTPQLSPRQNT